MVTKSVGNQMFHAYFLDWINLYKINSVATVTLSKYYSSHRHLKRMAPTLKVKELTRRSYQQVINDFAENHEKQTTLDFHHQLKGAIMDAVDEGIIQSNPTRKVIIKGKTPRKKKPKFLNKGELIRLLQVLKLDEGVNWDWFILLAAKTGLRFGEALALTPNDFDFSKQTVKINKAWNYQNKSGGFKPTKNTASNRCIYLDWQLSMQFAHLVRSMNMDSPIFVNKRVFNSTVNKVLERRCKEASVPIITIHSLRHTHASILLYANVSINSVAKRLGHSSVSTTQKTYLHIIKELENEDTGKILTQLSSLH